MKFNIRVKSDGTNSPLEEVEGELVSFNELPGIKFFVAYIPSVNNRNNIDGWKISDYKYGYEIFSKVSSTKNRAIKAMKDYIKYIGAKNLLTRIENLYKYLELTNDLIANKDNE